MTEPQIPKFMSENEQWCSKVVYSKRQDRHIIRYTYLYDLFTYVHYRLVMPRIKQRYPTWFMLSDREFIKLCQRMIEELKAESPDGCFETPSWLEQHKQLTEAQRLGVTCPYCSSSSDNIRSWSFDRWRCVKCLRTFKRQPT